MYATHFTLTRNLKRKNTWSELLTYSLGSINLPSSVGLADNYYENSITPKSINTLMIHKGFPYVASQLYIHKIHKFHKMYVNLISMTLYTVYLVLAIYTSHKLANSPCLLDPWTDRHKCLRD